MEKETTHMKAQLPIRKVQSKEDAEFDREGFYRYNLRKSLRITGRATDHPRGSNRPTVGATPLCTPR